MYCKNCGKSLPDNARFCDKCNMSVRKEKGKMDMIEELKEERLARQKAHEIEDRLKKIKKVKRKRYNAIALVVLGIIAVWGAIVGVSYYNSIKNSTLKGAEPELQQTDAPAPTPDVTEAPEDKDYTTITLDGIKITYPKIFDESEVVDRDCVASFSDEDGNAKIIIDRQTAILTPNELMDEYYRGILNAVIDNDASLATHDGYSVTITSGTKKYHKKAVIKDGEVFSYEIIYPKDSADVYETYIKHMDERFTVS